MIQVLKQVTSLIIPKFIARKPKIKHVRLINAYMTIEKEKLEMEATLRIQQ